MIKAIDEKCLTNTLVTLIQPGQVIHIFIKEADEKGPFFIGKTKGGGGGVKVGPLRKKSFF